MTIETNTLSESVTAIIALVASLSVKIFATLAVIIGLSCGIWLLYILVMMALREISPDTYWKYQNRYSDYE